MARQRKDELSDLAAASASKKRPASARKHLAQQQAETKEKRRIKTLAAITVAILILISVIIVMVIKTNVEEKSNPSSLAAAQTQPELPPIPDELESPADRPSEPIDDEEMFGSEIEPQEESKPDPTPVPRPESVSRAEEKALAARQEVAAVIDRAKQLNAPNLVPKLFEAAETEYDKAAEHFVNRRFHQAVQGWKVAEQAYEKAIEAAQDAQVALDARISFEKRLIKQFDRATLELRNESDYRKVMAVFEKGQDSFKNGRFADAVRTYEQAQQMIPLLELNVRRSTHAHVHAMVLGRGAARMLFAYAQERPVTDEQWDAMSSLLVELLLDETTIRNLTRTREGPYPQLASILLDDISTAISNRWGPKVAASFQIGVNLFAIDNILHNDIDADALTKQQHLEARRSIKTIRDASESIPYPDPFRQPIDELSDALRLTPGFTALKQSRRVFAEFLKELESDDAIGELIPISDPPL